MTRPILAAIVAIGLCGVLPASPVSAAEGIASFYGKGFHGRRTASGQRFNQHAMTAAHRSLGFGTKVRVTNVRTQRSVVVTITDRGPYIKGRLIDLSRGAAARIGMLKSGVAKVRLEVVGRKSKRAVAKASKGGLLEALF